MNQLKFPGFIFFRIVSKPSSQALSCSQTCVLKAHLRTDFPFLLSKNNKIWRRSISWGWIAICSTKNISSLVVGIVISVNNKASSIFSDRIPFSTVNSCSKYQAGFINADVLRPRFFSWIDHFQKVENIGCKLCLVKFGPCNNCTTWSTNSFYTIILSRTEKVFTDN